MSPPSWVSLPFPHPTPLGHHREPGCPPCVIQQLLTSHPFYTWWCIYVDVTFSVHPTLSLPHCVHKSFLYICISRPSCSIYMCGYFNFCVLKDQKSYCIQEKLFISFLFKLNMSKVKSRERQILCVESNTYNKLVNEMKKQQTNRCREQTSGYLWGKEGKKGNTGVRDQGKKKRLLWDQMKLCV